MQLCSVGVHVSGTCLLFDQSSFLTHSKSALQGTTGLLEPIQLNAPLPLLRWICLTEEVAGHGGDLNWRMSGKCVTAKGGG